MPKKHKNQALHNESFYNQIKKQSFNDWAVTGIFYAALHYIDGYLKSKNIIVKAHPLRLQYINKESKLKPIYQAYRMLYDESRNARYDFKKIDDKALIELYNKEFQAIKNQVGSLY